jgi:putative phage-type endonuclease
MIRYDMPQRSPEWYAARCGLLTGSVSGDMLAEPLKSGKEPACRRDLRVRLVVERLTGSAQQNGFMNDAMQWGIDTEAEAIAAYEAATGALVTPVGFLRHETLAAGCSPDGLVEGGNGLVEIKCPKSATHLAYFRAQVLPDDYLPQVTHNLWISGADWCDFVSYDPRFPARLQYFRVRTVADPKALAAYELVVRRFLDEVEREVAALTADPFALMAL